MKFLVDELPSFYKGYCPFDVHFLDKEGCCIDLCSSSKTENCPMHYTNKNKQFTECCFLKKWS